MGQEDQYKQKDEKVNPLVLDMVNRAFSDQREQDKQAKDIRKEEAKKKENSDR